MAEKLSTGAIVFIVIMVLALIGGLVFIIIENGKKSSSVTSPFPASCIGEPDGAPCNYMGITGLCRRGTCTNPIIPRESNTYPASCYMREVDGEQECQCNNGGSLRTDGTRYWCQL